MHQASEHASATTRNAPHPRPDHHCPAGGSPSLFSTNRVATRFHVGEHKRGRGVVFTAPGSTPPFSLSPHHATVGTAPPSSAWGRDNHVPPPHSRPPPIGHTPPRTRFSSPHGRVSTNQPSKRGRGGETMIAPPPPGERTHQSTQTPQANTGISANTQPQPPASNHAHSKPALPPPARTQETPTQQRVGAAKCERKRGTVEKQATGTNEAQTTNAGTQDNAHNKRANNQVCVRCAPAPAREDSAREGRSQ